MAEGSGRAMASPEEVLANSQARSLRSSSSQGRTPPQIHVPRYWRSAYAVNTIAGDCCNNTIVDVMIGWLKQFHPLTNIVPSFTLECTCCEHKPFCPNGVTSKYRSIDGILKCVRYVAETESRSSKEIELYLWTECMIRHNEQSIIAIVIAAVPGARNAIGRALMNSWKNLAHIGLYRAALKYTCVALGSNAADWLLGTRLTLPWPQRQRSLPEDFQEAEAHAELGRIALYFQNKVACNTMPKYAQWQIIKQVIWLTVANETRPALPCELVNLILRGVGLDFELRSSPL